MLKFYVRHGMQVVRVHTVISFKESKWMEKDISFNTQKRKNSENEFEKDFCNILENSFHGKTTKKFVIELE